MNGVKYIGKKPAIIGIHGGPGSIHRDLIPLVTLSDQYPVILYDQLGTGHSSRQTTDTSKWTVNHFVSEIGEIRKALKLNEVIVIGHSFGGTIAAEYATTRPKGLRAVILLSPLINTKQWLADSQTWVKQFPKAIQATIKHSLKTNDVNSPEYRKAVAYFA